MKILFTLIAALCITTHTLAQEEKTWKVGISADLYSSQVFPNGVVLHHQPIFGATLSIEHKSGIFLDIVGLSGFDNRWPHGTEDEVDYTVSYSKKIWKLRTTFSGTYIDSAHMGTQSLEDLLRIGLRIALADRITIGRKTTLTPWVFWDTYEEHVDAEHPFEGGHFIGMGVSIEHKITSRISLLLTSKIFNDTGAMGAVGGVVGSQSALFKISLSENWALKLETTGIISHQPALVSKCSLERRF